MHYEYTPQGVCARRIMFDLEDNKVSNLAFAGGCNGNLKAIGILCEGEDADVLIQKLAGNRCGFKNTSCADQLTKALAAAKEHAAGLKA